MNVRVSLRARKAGIKIRFKPAIFFEQELARQITEEIDREILKDLLGVMTP